MALFFNGQLYITPTTVSAVNDSALQNLSPSVGNTLALIGHCTGGRPKTPLIFDSPQSAAAALGTGDLATAAVKAFAPSSAVGGPNQIICMRVDPALQSSLTLLDSTAAPSILLTSTDYGQATNQIKAEVQSGSSQGLLLTTQRGAAYYTKDNVYQAAFSVQYSGIQATASMTIADATVTLYAPNGTSVAALNLNTFGTVQELVDAIGAVPGFAAGVLDGYGAGPTEGGLDFVTTQDVKTSLYTATATLQAAVNWYNSVGEGFVDAVQANGAGKIPANIPFTYLTGGTDGTATNTDWTNSLTAMQAVDAQWLVTLSPDPSIHAMLEAHVQFMSVQGRKERRGFVGLDVGSSITAVVAAANALDSDRMAECYPGYWDYDSSGTLTLYPPYMTAAIVGAMAAAVAPGTPLTNKSLEVSGLEFQLRNPTDTDALITGGVLAIEDDNGVFDVVQSVSTWIQNTNFNRVEISTGAAIDYALRTLRNALDPLRGSIASPQVLARAKAIAIATLNALSVPSPNGPGVFVGDAASPPWANLQLSVVADVLQVVFQGSPAIPLNYITITLYAVPFQSTSTSTSATG